MFLDTIYQKNIFNYGLIREIEWFSTKMTLTFVLGEIGKSI